MADRGLFKIDPTSNPTDDNFRLGWGKNATATINQTVTEFLAWLKTRLVASTTEPGLVEKATSGELASGTIDKYIDAKLLSDGVYLGSNPTYNLVTGSTGNNHCRKNGATKHIQLDGTISYSNTQISPGTKLMTFPIASWSPAPNQAIYGYIFLYPASTWIAYKIRLTTAREIELLETTAAISSNIPFSLNLTY